MTKLRKFKLHFNRIAMQTGNSKVWSIRLSNRCLHAEHIVIDVPLKTIFKPKSRQPRAFFAGEGQGYWMTDNRGDFLLITKQPFFTVNGMLYNLHERENAFQ